MTLAGFVVVGALNSTISCRAETPCPGLGISITVELIASDG